MIINHVAVWTHHIERLKSMRSQGVPVLGNPRTTGEGLYESVVADPEGNIVELTV